MKISGKHYRTIWLGEDGWSVEVIDQTLLPHVFEVMRLTNVAEAASAIATMVVRGAPLIGATAAYGMALAAEADASEVGLRAAYEELLATRPTAVNLRWALDDMQTRLLATPEGKRRELAYARAQEICDDDVATCQGIGGHGAALITAAYERAGKQRRINVLTHCNAG